jgi:hypothetical protein
MTMRLLPVATAAALLLLSGLVHGLWTDRWESPEALDAAVARVGRVPLAAGDWQGRALGPPDVDPEAFEQAGALSYWMRRYVSRRDRSEVTAVLMCGRRNRMAVHTPDVCFRAEGFALLDAPAAYVVQPAAGGGGPAQFRTSLFNAGEGRPAAGALRVFWAWNAEGEWQAPAGDARWAFRGAPFLYKLYVTHEARGQGVPLDQDAGVAFLKRLLPELHRTLFPAQKQ